MSLITLEQANHHLRLDLANDGASPPTFTDSRVPDVEMKISQAEAIILNYLKVSGDPDGSPPLWSDQDRSCVQAATLMALSSLYDDDKDRSIASYMVPNGIITLLLMRLRDPALA